MEQRFAGALMRDPGFMRLITGQTGTNSNGQTGIDRNFSGLNSADPSLTNMLASKQMMPF